MLLHSRCDGRRFTSRSISVTSRALRVCMSSRRPPQSPNVSSPQTALSRLTVRSGLRHICSHTEVIPRLSERKEAFKRLNRGRKGLNTAHGS
ncbi:hypothetical protein BD309DRAFT_994169 [Dichomitus squalens]|uniref:Uncharacterized protein n=2 Tax=Dichomitus squalens TaxID=114155 RepID=A0A4Q9PSC8_9APHY|nr:uncharacterized protein DICSQDRAFT_155426 [Dichomitus squalens LYAD-421 SS1]EJF60990.1 hypothetical protein DICSQDRAFT_155426 [Dichomitus squalens LYAD-421 SS1]TBU25515.1 hypothetical protein BD311DRAFT_780286 [Dichomitus squalens]TBU38863.1 hypothetical protein BD309DRAFT_994169 [Dichomitus squalens]TBU57323.1 hypothetical protein BD310DRAFT_949458 [Dichomitus squalens]